ncbi:unnamed protein product [Amoebophrya sp. A120]|nr:unnamed protein product [Amoebophrya sp. A120]|eukprot:GSA120T00025472001.1
MASNNFSIIHAWGSQSHSQALLSQEHVKFLDSAHIIFPVGRYLCIRNVYTNTDSYFLKQATTASTSVEAITSFAVSLDKTFIVSCETTTSTSSSSSTSANSNGGQVTIYNLTSNNSFQGTTTDNLGLNVKRSGYTSCAIDANHTRVALLTPQYEDPTTFFSARTGTILQLCELNTVNYSLTVLCEQTLPLELQKVTFAPYDSNLLLLSGNGGYLKLYKYNTTSRDLRPFPDFEGDKINPETTIFSTYTWTGPMPAKNASGGNNNTTSDTEPAAPNNSKEKPRLQLLQKLWAKQKEILAVNSQKQEIYLVDSQTLKIVEVLQDCFDDTISEEVKPLAICTFQKGFIIAGSDGYLGIWERLDSHSYRFVRNLYTGRKSNVVSIDIAVDDELFFGKEILQQHGIDTANAGIVQSQQQSSSNTSGTNSQAGVVLAFADGDFCYVNLAELYLAKEKLTFPANRSLAAHFGPVLSVSSANSELRPLFLTCAGSKDDSSLRLYNYETLELELSTFFTSEKAPIQCAIHPDGYSCAVAFADGTLRMFHLLANKIQQYAELRFANLKKVVYSPTNGNYLVVIYGKFLTVLETLNLNKLVTIKKHTSPIADVSFDFQALTMATVGIDGSFYVWDMSNYHKIAEYYLEPHKDCTDGNCLLTEEDKKSMGARSQLLSLYENFHATIAFDGDVTTNRRRWVVALSFKTLNTKESLGKTYGRLYDLYLTPIANSESATNPELLANVELACKLELPDAAKESICSVTFDRKLLALSRDEQRDSAWLMASRDLDSLPNAAAKYGGTTLFATTTSGTLWSYPFPLSKSASYEEFFVHCVRRKNNRASGPTLCALLPGENRMVTTSLDGSIFLLSVQDQFEVDKTKSTRSSFSQQQQAAAASPAKAGKTPSSSSTSKKQLQSQKTSSPSKDSNMAKKLPKGDEICLIEKQDLVKLEDQVEKLNHEIKQIELDSMQKLDQQRYAYEARLESTKITSEKSEVEALKERIVLLEDIIQEREQEPVRMVKALEAQHIAAQEQLEGMYSAKLQMENDRYSQLTKEMYIAREEAAEKLDKTKQDLKNEAEKTEKDLRIENADKGEEIAKYKALIKYVEQRYNTILKDEEQDRDHEISGLMDQATKNLQESQFKVNALKKEQETLLRGLNAMEKERQRFALLQKEHEENAQRMTKEMGALQEQITTLKTQVTEAEKVSKKKDKEIQDLKQTVEKTEKHKNAFEAELKFLNERIFPKEQKITELTGHLQDAGKEFVQKLKLEQNQQKSLENLKLTIKHQQDTIKHTEEEKRDLEKYINKFQRELYGMMHEKTFAGNDEAKIGLQNLRQLYQDYSGTYASDNPVPGTASGGGRGGNKGSSGTSQSSKKPPGTSGTSHSAASSSGGADAAGIEEMDRQKRQLSRSLKKLSSKSEQQTEMGKVNNLRKIGENSMLIEEINALRRSQKDYADKIKQMEMELKSLKNEQAGNVGASAANQMTPSNNLGGGINAGPRTPGTRGSNGKMPPIGHSKNKQLPNAKSREQLQEFASADGFPLMISMQNK